MGEYYNCSKYKEGSQETHGTGDRNLAREALVKYLHYFTRVGISHPHSLRCSGLLLESGSGA